MKITKRYTDGYVKCNRCGRWREKDWIRRDGRGCLTCGEQAEVIPLGYIQEKWEEVEPFTNTRYFVCLGCGTERAYDKRHLYKEPKYCSRTCFHKNRTIVTRSKNEIHFYKLCKEHFIDVLANPRIFGGFDCDILIRPLNIAIMWDGIHHRQQIFKNQKLAQTKARDAVRIREIRRAGYMPYTIIDNGGENKKFVQQEFERFLSVYPTLT